MPTLKTAKNVISIEVEGLNALAASLGEAFEKLVEKIHTTTKSGKGRVIVSGMGKSGHIAGKIAATMASTGTPAFFVHPAEASHGDMGMITQNDIVILLSNSGETAELKDIITYCKRFGIFLVGFIRNPKSTLTTAADIALVLPNTPEANNVNAPTTSTTQMLALGDAVAVCLLEKNGFAPDDFKVLHPGGKLGAGFTFVADLMHKAAEVPLAASAERMPDILIKMTSYKFGCVGITQNDKLVGIITDGDLRRHMDFGLLDKRAEEVMTKNPITLEPNNLAAKALNIMNEKRITSLFVCTNGKPEGIIHIHDLLRAGV
jgi:arabinose-5-phosphate isomerase